MVVSEIKYKEANFLTIKEYICMAGVPMLTGSKKQFEARNY